MLSIAALIVAVGLQGLAGAAPEAASNAASLSAGRAAFDRFDLVGATAAFERAVVEARRPADKAQALAWLGALRADNADFDAARGYFREALSLDRNVLLPPTLSPAVLDLLQQERGAAASRGLSSSPAATPTVTSSSPPSTALADGDIDDGRPRWALLSGGTVAALGVVAVGGGAAMGLSAVARRDEASSEAFQSDAASGYQQARQGALWANVLYGAGAVLVVGGGGLMAASFLGADE